MKKLIKDMIKIIEKDFKRGLYEFSDIDSYIENLYSLIRNDLHRYRTKDVFPHIKAISKDSIKHSILMIRAFRIIKENKMNTIINNVPKNDHWVRLSKSFFNNGVDINISVDDEGVLFIVAYDIDGETNETLINKSIKIL